MNIHVIGSSGFIGRAIQAQAQAQEIDICSWSHHQSSREFLFDLYSPDTWSNLLGSNPHTVIFLSWPGLPHYDQPFHVTKNLPWSIEFASALVDSGCKNIIVSGTCYEYGNQNGEMLETNCTLPCNFYGIAKDSLRASLELVCRKRGVRLAWARIFYAYGKGQNPNSLYPSLLSSIKERKKSFPMSSGKQIRDFISASDVARQLLFLALNPSANGIYNCGSGKPQTIYEFVRHVIASHGVSIEINRGVYPDRGDEPSAFWANMDKLNSLAPEGLGF